MTPLSLAIKGKMCPGRPSSSAVVSGLAKARSVLARSEAEIPVVQPSPSKSTETVNGVACKEVFRPTIISRSSSSHLRSDKGAQMSPLPYLAIKLTFSGVINSARSEEHTSELQSRPHLVCRLLLEKKKKQK